MEQSIGFFDLWQTWRPSRAMRSFLKFLEQIHNTESEPEVYVYSNISIAIIFLNPTWNNPSTKLFFF